MEETLKLLFDYGRFRQDSRLEAMLRQAEARLAAEELSEEQLGMVYAAGAVEQNVQQYKNNLKSE